MISNHDRFKDAQVETDQPLEFESDQVEFKVSQPARKWKITRLNSSVVRSLIPSAKYESSFELHLFIGEKTRCGYLFT